jgi:hypothetical protein
MIGIVKLALRRPYTFIVMAVLIMIFGVASTKQQYGHPRHCRL